MTPIFFAVLVLSVLGGVMHQVMLRLNIVTLRRSAVVIRTLVFLVMLLPGFAGAHGNVELEADPCVRRVGGSMVHFNAYQPQHAATAHYCTEIPGEGETFLVVDLVDPTLRTLPVGVRVVKGMSESSEDQTVAYWPPTTHPNGVLRGEATLTQGLYTVIIAPEGLSPSSYLLRVQQVDYGAIVRTAMGPLTVLLILALIGYEFSKSRRQKTWRVPMQS